MSDRFRVMLMYVMVHLQVGVHAQDVHFAQFYNAPLVINPANTGDMEGEQRLSLIHREQWRSTGSPFRTQAFSYDMPILRQRLGKKRLGVGLSAFTDKAGSSGFGDSQIHLNAAYGIRTGESTELALGLQGGYGQRSAMLNELRWDNQYNGVGHDASLPTGETMGDRRTSYVDLGAGMAFSGGADGSTGWKVGVSTFHLNQPRVSLFGTNNDRLFRRYVVHAEMRIVGERWTWSPKLFVAQQGGSREINVGALMHRRVGKESRYTQAHTSSAIHIGCFYRYGDAIVPAVQFEYRRKLMVGLTYDVNVSKLRAQTHMRGGLELSLNWIGIFKDKRIDLPPRPR